MSYPIPHGTLGGYSNHGCRCDLCKEANRQHRVSYRDRNPERSPTSGCLYNDPRHEEYLKRERAKRRQRYHERKGNA